MNALTLALALHSENNVCMCAWRFCFSRSVSGDKQIQLSMNVYIDFQYSQVHMQRNNKKKTENERRNSNEQRAKKSEKCE